MVKNVDKEIKNKIDEIVKINDNNDNIAFMDGVNQVNQLYSIKMF